MGAADGAEERTEITTCPTGPTSAFSAEATLGELTAAKAELTGAHAANVRLSEELIALKAEKLEVRGRLEKLLSHIDQLGAV